MAVGDVLKLTLTEKWDTGGEKMLNNFYYLVNNAGATAIAFITAWESAVLPSIRAIQHSIVKVDSVRCINLFDLGDFADFNFVGAGTASSTGDVLPMFNAMNISLKLNTRAVRPGSKRFSGIPDDQTTANVVVGSTYITALNTLRDKLVANIPVVSEPGAVTPIVVKRIPVAATTTTKDHYRDPETPEELVYGTIVAGLWNLRVSHQVSRGNGR